MNLLLAPADLMRAVLFAVAHVTGGSLGTSILIVSTVIRIALLPLTIRIARRAREHQQTLKELEPELERIRRRHAADQQRVIEETMALHRKHGLGLLPRGTLGAMLVQAPIYGALYRAITTGVRRVGGFLWMRDLAEPDIVLAIAASILTVISAKVDAGAATPSRAWIAGAAITFVFAWRIAAGVGLYWVASSAVGVGQSLILRRGDARSPR
jgi:YidC/Oxa1 family membrane protein insertase